jgi:hypothetical protein
MEVLPYFALRVITGGFQVPSSTAWSGQLAIWPFDGPSASTVVSA